MVGGGNTEQLLNGYGIFFLSDENVLYSIEVVVAQYCKGTKCPWIVHFKIVNFMSYEFHINF